MNQNATQLIGMQKLTEFMHSNKHYVIYYNENSHYTLIREGKIVDIFSSLDQFVRFLIDEINMEHFIIICTKLAKTL